MYKLFALLSLPTLVYAQSETGGSTLNGHVTDPSNAAVVGAKVTALQKETGFSRTTQTTDAGAYTFVRLPVGVYDLTVELQGFQPTRHTASPLPVGGVVTLDLQLRLGTTQEVVSVTADIPLIETTRTQTGTTVNANSVANLPINGRNFLDIALSAPMVVRDPRGGDLSFAGQRGPANSLLVDGGDANNLFFGQSTGRQGTRNPYSFSQDSVQEFQISTSGYSADTGRAGGGVINVVTKSGTNDLHGGGFWFFRDRAMNANTFINNERNIRKPFYHFNQFGGHAGGPIAKDKLFFFFDYDGQRNTTPNVVFLSQLPPADVLSQQAFREIQPKLAPYTQGLKNNIFLTKIDWNISANQRLSVRWNEHRFTGTNFESGGTSSALEHTGNAKVTTHNVTVNYSKVFGPSTLWDARYIYVQDDEPGTSNSPPAPETVLRQNNATVLSFGRNNFSPRFTNTRRNQTVQSLSIVSGRHTYKFGGDINIETIANEFPGTFAGVYSFNSYADFAARRPFSYVQAFAGPGTPGPRTQPDLNEYAFFAQDSWRTTDRLTLNYGVRYDLMNSAESGITNPNAALRAAGIDTGRINLDTNNFGARFGFAYRLTQSDRLLLRGGYGNFYARTPQILTGTSHSNNGIQVLNYELRTNLPVYPNVLAAPPTGAAAGTPNLLVMAPDYVNPITHQFSLNLEARVASDMSVTLGYLAVHGSHLTRTRDINLFPAESVAGTLTGAPVTFFRHPGTTGPARPNPAFGRISYSDSGADSLYHGG
ncbi:MAG: TonB-dependent receptor, partial [Bryobacteraceae bacterium]